MANNWTTAERNLFEYLLASLGDTEGETAFPAVDGTVYPNEYLPYFADEQYQYMWTCWFEGGGESMDRGPSDGLGYLRGTAMFRGFFLTRDKAREYALKVALELPIHNQAGPSGTACTLWRHLFMQTDPGIRPASALRALSQSEKAGEVKGWLLDIAMDGGLKGTT